jgi:hypothetical protein
MLKSVCGETLVGQFIRAEGGSILVSAIVHGHSAHTVWLVLDLEMSRRSKDRPLKWERLFREVV